jgi:hypothetical protein
MTLDVLLEPDTRTSRADDLGIDAPPRRSDETVDEPLTPELALVDPELARRAREQLSHHTLEPRPAAVAHEESAPAPPVRVAQSTESAPGLDGQVAPRTRRRRAIILSIVLGAAATAAVLRVVPLRAFFWESTGPIVSPAARESSTRVPADTIAPRATPPRPVKSGTKASTPSRPTAKSQARAAPRPAAEPQRAFAWVPVPKATYYIVRFYRGRKEILEARPSAARLLLPRKWAFKGRRYSLGPGRYSWTVRPGFGRPSQARYGRPIVAAELVVPAASVG